MSEYNLDEGAWISMIVLGPTARSEAQVNRYDNKVYVDVGIHPQQITVTMSKEQALQMVHAIQAALQDQEIMVNS